VNPYPYEPGGPPVTDGDIETLRCQLAAMVDWVDKNLRMAAQTPDRLKRAKRMEWAVGELANNVTLMYWDVKKWLMVEVVEIQEQTYRDVGAAVDDAFRRPPDA
jgi:hypothetical protein